MESTPFPYKDQLVNLVQGINYPTVRNTEKMYIRCVSKIVTSMLKAGGIYNNHSPLDGVSLFYKNLTYYFKVK